jgi:TetR/AcrR family transcriptional regulator of autoinduction and epiphytic fitness
VGSFRTVTDGHTTDGRELRSRRTREAIVEAWLLLLEEGVVTPTARLVADRAGIGLRTVFQHFDDLEALHAAASARQMERVGPLLAPRSTEGPLDERIEDVILGRATLFERIAPVRRAALRAEAASPTIARILEVSDQLLADDLGRVFARELDVRSATERETMLAALDVTFSFMAWDHLRSRRGLSVAAAKSVLSMQTTALMA